ncbi:MAG: DUF1611 domain-containing protein [Candidatus Thermoplasmatota archaeon]
MEKNRALLYVDRLYKTADGKTAHGLIRYSKRYHITGVVDTTLQPGDAGEYLDGIPRGIPLFNNLDQAHACTDSNVFIIGAVSEGGVLPKGYDHAVLWALEHKYDVVSGLHEFLSDNPRFQNLAKRYGCTILDVRKKFRDYKRFYTGEVKKIQSIRIAVLGTDSAIGKRTLAVLIVEEFKRRGKTADMIYTGQTGWMQGWPHGLVLDAVINDFVAGGIEGALLDSWNDERPQYMILEGQGSLVHPFFPGGFEILTAGNVHGFLLVDAPNRLHLDGFSGYPMPDPKRVVQIAELLTEKKLLGIGINKENIHTSELPLIKKKYERRFHVPVVEPISEGVKKIVDMLEDTYE